MNMFLVKIIPYSRLKSKNHTLFQTKTARHIPIQLIYRSPPPRASASSRIKIRPKDPSIETRFIDNQPKEQFEQFDSDDELVLVCRLSTNRLFSRTCRTMDQRDLYAVLRQIRQISCLCQQRSAGCQLEPIFSAFKMRLFERLFEVPVRMEFDGLA